jgi:methionine-gamma-lyase
MDVVVHSATKYLSGHGDAVGGVIAGKADFVNAARDHTVRYFGGVLAPFNAYLIQRGIHTLPLRMAAHNANAMAVASYLEGHGSVAAVSYPGLESHPQHALACRQMHGFGGMVCFELKGGVAAGARLMDRVKLCALATSLGDTRTLISHPASTTHSVLSPADRLKQGVTDGLVRLSVGIEDVNDILEDLEQALA